MIAASQSELNPRYFSKAWDRLATEHFDLVIIGGGSVGAGAALDAATRGLKVAVVEARDIASGTSSRSSKMFHGGLRYLAMFDFALVAEALRERELSMSTLAPHLVKPLRFIFPLTHRVWERVMMFSGFALYDLMGGAKTVPMQKHLSRKGTLKHAPGLKDDAVVGGVRYFDTLVDDARHTMTVLRSAAHHGAVVRTATQVTDLERDHNDRVVAAHITDTETGASTTVRASVFINATGVWNDSVQKLAGAKGTFQVHTSKGIHLVIPKACIEADAAMAFMTEKSILFIIPWGEFWILGTTDTEWTLDLADPAATSEDIEYILTEVNKRVKRPITRDDILGVYSGLRPLLRGKSDATTNLSRNHAVSRIAPGMISVAGGKYTTYRIIGKDAVDLAVKELNFDPPESITDRTPLLGADGYHALNNQIPSLATRTGLTETQVEHLLNRYGSLMWEVLEPAVEKPELLQPVPGAPEYLLAEVLYAVTHEGAIHLADILERRLRISMEYAHRGAKCAQPVAEFVAEYLDWDEATVRREVEVYKKRLDAALQGEQLPSDAEANAVVTQAPDAYCAINDAYDTAQS